MSEKLPNNPDYLKDYPDAVQDIEKAHAMALASNQDWTKAAVQNLAIKIVKGIESGEGVGGSSFRVTRNAIYRTEIGKISEARVRGDIDREEADAAVGRLMEWHGSDELGPKDGGESATLPLCIRALISLREYRLKEESVEETLESKKMSIQRHTRRAKARETAAAREYDQTQQK